MPPLANLIGRHPKGTRARVLLTSVFGPYARDDEFGSRRINPMELYHNQVTREQGVFSLRMFHRSWGIMMKGTNPVVSAVIGTLRRDIGYEFGPLPRLAGGLLGPFLLWTARREERRLADGVTYEPSPIVDRRNWLPAGAQPAMQGLPQGANIPFPATEPQ